MTFPAPLPKAAQRPARRRLPLQQDHAPLGRARPLDDARANSPPNMAARSAGSAAMALGIAPGDIVRGRRPPVRGASARAARVDRRVRAAGHDLFRIVLRLSSNSGRFGCSGSPGVSPPTCGSPVSRPSRPPPRQVTRWRTAPGRPSPCSARPSHRRRPGPFLAYRQDWPPASCRSPASLASPSPHSDRVARV